MEQLGEADKAAARAPGPVPARPASFFRQYFLDPAADERHHVIVRTTHDGFGVQTPSAPARADPADSLAGIILLNKYPYANGHLLVALGDPRPRLLDYSTRQRAELWRLTDLAVELCERVLMPQGVNVGVNQGHAAGAGVPEHVHVHVVPRWLGDVNFISVVGQVRVIPGALNDMARRYRDAWNALATAAR